MAIRITTLSDNVAGSGCAAEWGLSLLIETEKTKILLDTGMGMAAVRNADFMGIDLATIDKIVLSHGHYDHTGGLREILSRTGKVELIAHPDIWDKKYVRLGDSRAYIGIPFVKETLEALGASINLTKKPYWIGDDIVTTGEIPMVTEYEDIDAVLHIERAGELIPDPVLDDRALIIKSEQGLVIVLGCAHRGAINTLYHAQQITGEKRIHTVIGGLHLRRITEERVYLTAAALQEMGVQRVGACHCTDMIPRAILYQQLGDVFFFNNTALQITID